MADLEIGSKINRMKMYNRTTWHQWAGISIAALLALTGCNKPSEPLADAPVEQPPHSITVITQVSPATYFENNGPDGLEFHLIENFAKRYQYDLNIVIANQEGDIYQALDQGLADIALLGKPLSLARQSSQLQSQPYMDVTTQLVYRHGSGKPHAFEDLAGKKVVVQDNEQYREKYEFLKAHYGELNWEFSKKSIDELLGMVNQGLIDYTLIDSHQFINRQALYTHTRIAFDIYYPEPVTLLFSPNTHTSMRDDLDTFFDEARDDGTIASLLERFYGHADDVNPRGSMTFFRRVQIRLPNYQDLIEQVADEYKIDWRLLAAIAYQESHWNPRAKSPTGVRGMMMLTQGTAKDMGVDNRLDTAQSLRGGAKYFKRMHRYLPSSIKEPDRTWFALAAYNVGIGHIRDARAITEFQGGNPDSWADVKKNLPLLERKDWYEYTDYGFARGSESVSYVQHIRYYNDLLEWRFPNSGMPSTASKERRTELNVKPLQEVIREAKAQQQQAIPIEDGNSLLEFKLTATL